MYADDANSTISNGSKSEPPRIHATMDSETNRCFVFDFTFTDAGTADGLATIIEEIKITQGDANDVANWTDAIAGAKLYGPDCGEVSGTMLEASVTDDSLTFGYATNGNDIISIADGSSETYQVYIWLVSDLSGVTDGNNLEFKIAYGNVSVDGSGTSFGSGSVESGDTRNAIDKSTVIEWNGGASGDWNTAGNWTPSSVPGGSDHVIISDGATVTIYDDDNANCDNLWIHKGATLKIVNNGGADALRINGDLFCNGTLLETSTLTIELNGSNNIIYSDGDLDSAKFMLTDNSAVYKLESDVSVRGLKIDDFGSSTEFYLNNYDLTTRYLIQVGYLYLGDGGGTGTGNLIITGETSDQWHQDFIDAGTENPDFYYPSYVEIENGTITYKPIYNVDNTQGHSGNIVTQSASNMYNSDEMDPIGGPLSIHNLVFDVQPYSTIKIDNSDHYIDIGNNFTIYNSSGTNGGTVTIPSGNSCLMDDGNLYVGTSNSAGFTLNLANNIDIYGGSGTFTMADIDDILINVTYASGTYYAINDFTNEDSYTFYGTVKYNSGSGQKVMGSTYNDVIFDGTGSKELQTNITVNGDLTIDNGTLDANSSSHYDIDMKGNWINNGGTFTDQNGTVTFSGSNPQSIKSNSSEFYDLTINNTNNIGITLSDAVSISHQLTLTDGVINTTAANLLIIKDDATSVNTGSVASHVDGPMRKDGNDEFTFPVGKDGIWAPIGFCTCSGVNVGDQWTAEYFFDDPDPENDDDIDGSINHISDIEYWDLDRTSGSGNCKVTLHWKSCTDHLIDNLTDLTIAHYHTGQWNIETATASGTTSEGFITTGARVTTFSKMTPGSISEDNPLPVELIYFEASCYNNVIQLDWETASEHNNDYFLLQRSVDGIEYRTVGQISGNGNSVSNKQYAYIDMDIPMQAVYYRLIQVDYNGEKTKYAVIEINCHLENKSTIDLNVLRATPTSIDLLVSTSETINGKIAIYSLSGRLIREKNQIFDEGTNKVVLNFAQLPYTGYIVTLETKNQIISKKVFLSK